VNDAVAADFDENTQSWFAPVSFLPLIELADYADIANATAASALAPETFGFSSKQDRIKCRSIDIDFTFFPIPIPGSPANPITTWFIAWYIAKLSYQETANAVALGGTGLNRYDPVGIDALHLHQLPLIRFGTRRGLSKFLEANLPSFFPHYQVKTRFRSHVTLKTDEELYFVYSASFAGGLSEDPPPTLSIGGHHRCNIVD